MQSQGSRPDRLMAHLGTLDRVTLRLWRTLNVLGWSALGVAVAMLLHWLRASSFGLDQSAGYHVEGPVPTDLGVGATIAVVVERLLIASLAAFAISTVVGFRVWTRRGLVGALAALIYALIAIVALEHDRAANLSVIFPTRPEWVVPNSLARALIHDLAILTVVPMTVAVTAFGNKKARERARA